MAVVSVVSGAPRRAGEGGTLLLPETDRAENGLSSVRDSSIGRGGGLRETHPPPH